MKKCFLLLIWILIPLLLCSQSMSVINPHKGTVVDAGKPYMIKWAKSGNLSPDVKINLFRNSVAQSNFVLQLTGPNSGSMNWNVPANLTKGQYCLRIKTSDNKVKADSALFTIQPQGTSNKTLQIDPSLLNQRTVSSQIPQLNTQIMTQQPVIGVSEPKANSTVFQTQSVNVRWKTSGVMFNQVRIDAIHQDTGKQFSVAPAVPNTGLFKWNLAQGVWSPGKWKIRIKPTIGGAEGTSGVFNIAKKASAPGNIAKLRTDFLTLINNYRKSKGLNPLVLDSCLNKAAQGHSEWMQATGNFSHKGENGSQFWDRCSSAGCSCDAENIHWGSSSALGCFTSWKGSPGHNANMLGSHTKIGIGVSGLNWTADFK